MRLNEFLKAYLKETWPRPLSAIWAATKTSKAAFFAEFYSGNAYIYCGHHSFEKTSFSATSEKGAMSHTQKHLRNPPETSHVKSTGSRISTFSFSKSTARVPPTAKHTHVYTASSWVQNWKQNWNSCPFSIFMIKTSFTLFFLKKTTQKSRFSIKFFFQKIDEFLLFLLGGP